ncbi:MAG: PRC-barrel domain-containing protein [Solirubrobacterales bacterium]
MAEAAPAAGLPTLGEALSWIGFDLDDAGGARLGRVHGVFVDAGSGEPAWLIATLGRRRTKKIAVPLANCAGAGGRVWTAHERQALGTAPTVDPQRPLLREHELTIAAHYGIGERMGRAAEVAARPEGSVTSRPA